MRRLVAVAIAACVWTCSPMARGDDAVEAQKRFAEGVKSYDLAERGDVAAQKHDPQRYEAAYRAFAQAYAIYRDDRILWNLALSEVNSDRYLDGLSHLRLYEMHEHVLDQPKHKNFERLRKYTERAMAATGHITIEAPAGTSLSLDGKTLGQAPVVVQDVAAGDHVIDGLGQHAQTSVQAGAAVVVTIAPPPAAPPAPVAAGPAPPARDPWSGHAAAPPATPNTTMRDTVRWSTSGLAVVGLGVGLGFMADANSRAANLNAYRSSHAFGCASMQSATCAETQSMRSGYSGAVSISATALIVAGISAVAAVGAWTLWPSGPEVEPLVAPHQAAIQLVGRF